MTEPEFSPEVKEWMDMEPELKDAFMKYVVPLMGDNWKEALNSE